MYVTFIRKIEVTQMGVNKFNSEGYYDPTAYEALTKIVNEARQKRSFRPIVYQRLSLKLQIPRFENRACVSLSKSALLGSSLVCMEEYETVQYDQALPAFLIYAMQLHRNTSEWYPGEIVWIIL